MSIANLAAQFCARSTKTVNAATIDDEIKVYVAALDAFDHRGQLRSLVSDDVVDSATISQAKTLVENLDKLSYGQKQDVLKQLKEMTDNTEKQIMGKLLAASANSEETTIEGLVNAATAPEPEVSLIASLLGVDSATILQIKTLVENLYKVKELVAG